MCGCMFGSFVGCFLQFEQLVGGAAIYNAYF